MALQLFQLLLKRTIPICILPIGVFAAIWLLSSATSAQNKPEVDVALVLAVDCSYSVSDYEYDLQMQGLAQAFAAPDVIAAIKKGRHGSIAVTLIQWSGLRIQKVSIPWTLIDDAVSARRFAGAISAAPRLAVGKTSISAIIDYSVFQIATSPVTAFRYVIDISADGVNNSGADRPDAARDRAVAAGITINGLAIVNEVNNLDIYFRRHVAGGASSFVMVANDYKAYGAAIKRKLLKEITDLHVS